MPEKACETLSPHTCGSHNSQFYCYQTVSSHSSVSGSILLGDIIDDTVVTPNHHYEYDKMNSWISSLRYNYIFDSGFSESYRSLKPLADSCCCPCSSTMKKWREQFGLNFMKKNNKCCGSTLIHLQV